MAHVHYKFSSKLSYDTLVFDGPHITLADLKSRIMGREKLRASDCDLQITNAQNREEYTESEGLISKGASVIVKRVPIIGAKVGSKNNRIQRPDLRLHSNYGAVKSVGHQSFSVSAPLFSKMINLAHADASEEDKLRTLSNQSLYDPLTYSQFTNVPHAKYTCYRCGNGGHHIKNCPTIATDKNMEPNVKIRKSSGIPRSFMVEVDDPNTKGAMLTSSGRYAIPTIDAEAYAIGKKERPPFLLHELPKLETKKVPVPEELVCLICQDLMSDAVVIPCCGNSYCDDCIRSALLDSEDHICPTCQQSSVSPDTLIANKFLRQAVNNYTKEKGDAVETLPSATAAATLPPARPKRPAQEVDPRSRVSVPLPAASSTSSTPDTSHQPATVQRESPGTDAEGKVSNESSTTASLQATTLDSAPEHLEAASTNPQGFSSGSAQSQSSRSNSWQPPMSSTSSSSYSSNGQTDPNRQRHLNSSLHGMPPALFPPLPFPPFHLSQQQSLRVYPPGYPPPPAMWNPSCPPVSSSSSIPPLIPKDWYRDNRRSPDRGTTYRSSYSQSKSKYSKSYSHSPSRSRSRSRSKERSRVKVEHTGSSYTYGYKRSRSPTPSSSSSSHESHHRKSRQSSRQSSRHYDKRSSRSGSRKVEGHSSRDPCASQPSSQDQESQQYLEWKRQYKEWCDKYFNSYVNHFQQLPPQHVSHPPPHPPPHPKDDRHSRCSDDKRSHPRRSRKSSSESHSSDSCSPFSKSSKESRSPASNLSSDSSSSPPKDDHPANLNLKKDLDHNNDKKQETKSRGQGVKQCNSVLTDGTVKTGSRTGQKDGKDVQRTLAGHSEPVQHLHRTERRSSRSEKRHKQAEKIPEGRRRSTSSRRTKETSENLSDAGDTSGSEKKRKRRREEYGRREAEDSQKTKGCSENSRYLSLKHKKQRVEKKRETQTKEKDVWENRVKVNTLKKINIKINMTTKDEKVSEGTDQAETVAETLQELKQETGIREEDSVETSEDWQVTDVYLEFSKDNEVQLEEERIVPDGENKDENILDDLTVSQPEETSEVERVDDLPEEAEPIDEVKPQESVIAEASQEEEARLEDKIIIPDRQDEDDVIFEGETSEVNRVDGLSEEAEPIDEVKPQNTVIAEASLEEEARLEKDKLIPGGQDEDERIYEEETSEVDRVDDLSEEAEPINEVKTPETVKSVALQKTEVQLEEEKIIHDGKDEDENILEDSIASQPKGISDIERVDDLPEEAAPNQEAYSQETVKSVALPKEVKLEEKIIPDGEDRDDTVFKDSIVSQTEETWDGRRVDDQPQGTEPILEVNSQKTVTAVASQEEAPEEPVVALNSESIVTDDCRIEEGLNEVEKILLDLCSEEASPLQQEDVPFNEVTGETTETEANEYKGLMPIDDSRDNSCMAPSSGKEHALTFLQGSENKDDGEKETKEMDTQNNAVNITERESQTANKEEKESECSSSAYILERIFPSVSPPLSDHEEVKEVEGSIKVFSAPQTKLPDKNVSILKDTKEKQVVNSLDQTVGEADEDQDTQPKNKMESFTFEPQEPKVFIPGLDFDDPTVEEPPHPDLPKSKSSRKESPKPGRESSIKGKTEGGKRESRQEQWKKYKLEKERQEEEKRQEILNLMSLTHLQREAHLEQDVKSSIGSSSNGTDSPVKEGDGKKRPEEEEEEELKTSVQQVDDGWIRSM